MKNQYGKVWMWTLIVIALLIVGGGVYFLIHQQTYSPAGTATTTPPVTANTYGMVQYTDSDFNFTFWYPNSWQILPTTTKDTTSFPGGTLVKTLQIGSPGGVMIYIVNSSAQTITDEQDGHASPIAQTKYFYNSASQQWMVAYPEGINSGTSSATTTANVSNTTMSGLIMFPSGRRFDTSIIPLSTTNFLVVSDGGGSNATVLAKTISLAGGSVSPSVLSVTLQTEANTYTDTNTKPQACPQIAKECPDGSYVGPTGPNCTFVCPSPTTSINKNFYASPTSGTAPLSVQFISSAPQGSNVGNTVNFGDGTNGNLGFIPVCSSCNALGTVSHTYVTPGIYTATLTSGTCVCPEGGICNCPNMQILGTARVTVNSASTAPNIQQLNAPGSVSLQQDGIAEIRNKSFYFTLQSISSSLATVQITPVGCWNSFPSDTPPQIRCMIAVMPIPPQTLSVSQTYSATNYGITLTQISNGTATFSVNASSAVQ